MKGDFTRFTHDPLKHYTQVLRQQGRVDLDADPNEQVQIDEHLSTTETIDVVGRTGYPRYLGGFEVTDAGGGELAIGFGRMYVDGILCENEAIDAPVASFPAADALVVAERDLARLSGAHVIEVRAPGQAAERRRVTATDPATRRLTLAAALPAALRGAAAPTVRRVRTYLDQPDLPSPDALSRTAPQLVYLDVWQRHMTGLEDPEIREPALGGPDTATRVKTVWQVRVGQAASGADCASALAALVAPSDARLSTVPAPAGAEVDPCYLEPDPNWRGLENRLYRVEVHDGAAKTFKWSRDNGAITLAIEQFDGDTVVLESLGRDQLKTVAVHDIVEVLDDMVDLADEAGTLARVVEIDHARRRVKLSVNVSQHAAHGHPKLRRWDRSVDLEDSAAPTLAIDTTAKTLDSGVQIRFAGTTFPSGDYWTFTTRAAGTNVERLEDALPEGITHHRAALALITWSGTGPTATPTIRDCRVRFPPLTNIHADDVFFDDTGCHGGATTVQEALDGICAERVLRYVGGDGQEARPGQFVPSLLEVGVEDGLGRPASGTVRFTVTGAGAKVSA